MHQCHRYEFEIQFSVLYSSRTWSMVHRFANRSGMGIYTNVTTQGGGGDLSLEMTWACPQHLGERPMLKDFRVIFIPIFKDFWEKTPVDLSINQVSFHFKCTFWRQNCHQPSFIAKAMNIQRCKYNTRSLFRCKSKSYLFLVENLNSEAHI